MSRLTFSGARGAGEGLLEALRSRLPEPAPEKASCQAHDWPPPAERGVGKPPPPRHSCPHCRRENEHRERRPAPVAAIETVHPTAIGANPRYDAALKRCEKTHPEKFGRVRPGTPEEAEVLQRIDLRREEEREREARRNRRGGHVVIQRPENGQLVLYRHAGRGRGLIRDAGTADSPYLR